MIKNIPSAFEAFDASVVVPGIRVAADIVNDNAAVGVGAQGMKGSGVRKTGRLSSFNGCIQKDIDVFILADGCALVKEKTLFVDQAFLNGFRFQRFHVAVHFTGAKGKLPPEIIDSFVVVNKDGGIDTVA